MKLTKHVSKTVVQSRAFQKVLDGKIASKAADILGFSRVKPDSQDGLVDLTGICHNPVEAVRRSGNRRVLIDVPLCKMIDLNAVFPSRHSNPYYLTAHQYVDNPNLIYADSALKIYYESFYSTKRSRVA